MYCTSPCPDTTYLDERNVNTKEGIADGDGVVRPTSGIENNAVGAVCSCRLNTVDDCPLPVALEELDMRATGGSLFLSRGRNVVESLGTIDCSISVCGAVSSL